VLASDVSNGSEDATWSLMTQVAGTSRSRFSATPTETVLNEDSVDVDFRVESNGNANMLVVDGGNDKVGIGTNSPARTLTVNASENRVASITHTAGTYAFATFSDANTSNDGSVRVGALTNDLVMFSGGSERMRISGTDVLIGKTATDFGTDGVRLTGSAASNFSASNGTPMNVNRNGDDGGLINFTQAGTLEGGISVSGTTVSYVGGHISRWSQLTDGTKDTSIVKGTVMTNLDQMAVWTKDGVTEDNEQLNCMAVSSVEGDANVAGVFVNWDDDDEDYTADMNIAMTGDMVIRIASGTTVARGDLLMSAGDGTAKPQDDDIVRSKTIAKVTSTTKSHTYDDGTYLVPCVLMAC
jgi:hypothetical protein